MVALVSGAATDAAAAHGQDWGPWGMHMMWGSWGTGMMLMMVIVWAALIAALVFFIRWVVTAAQRGRQTGAGHSAESALDILQKRYARGEISKEECADMATCSRKDTDARCQQGTGQAYFALRLSLQQGKEAEHHARVRGMLAYCAGGASLDHCARQHL